MPKYFGTACQILQWLFTLTGGVRAAEAYFRYCPEELRPKLARAILDKAREFGVDVESPTILQYATE